jgi:hypothetical protein
LSIFILQICFIGYFDFVRYRGIYVTHYFCVAPCRATPSGPKLGPTYLFCMVLYNMVQHENNVLCKWSLLLPRYQILVRFFLFPMSGLKFGK